MLRVLILLLLLNVAYLSREKVRCDIVIAGGGAAGVYTMHLLAGLYGKDICLIEQNDRLGGRIYDVSPTPGPDSPVFGLGALRTTESQKQMKKLAHELKIELQRQESDVEVFRARGKLFYRDLLTGISDITRMCKESYRMQCATENGTDPDTFILTKLLQDYEKHKEKCWESPDFVTFLTELIGDEGLQFLRDCVRYNSVFTSVSTHGMLDFLSGDLMEMGFHPTRYYPKGGMSQFISRMVQKATDNEARFFLGEPVQQIDVASDTELYTITTPNYEFVTTQVICAIDPTGLEKVRGNVAQEVKESIPFKMILPKKLAIVAAWWPERWWERSEVGRDRKLSRVVSHENCFNTMDIPTFPYAKEQNVTRAVYDDGACVQTWETLQVLNNASMLQKTVIESLQNVFYDIKIPNAKYMKLHVHPNAWHFQHPHSRISNQEILDWSVRPLKGKQKFSLVGEAYNLSWAAWVEGAIKSVAYVLRHHGFQFSNPSYHEDYKRNVAPPAKVTDLLFG